MTINEIFSTIRDWAVEKFQPKGNYAESADIPTKASQLQNDAGYISAIPDDYITETDLADKGYLTSESDPTVPEWAKQPAKPQYTKAEIGLGDADNTSDMSKPVSAAQQAAIDGVYQQATGYTDQKIADLINGAPSTLDTLGEIAQALKDNEDVVQALDQAIGTKANQAEFDGHTGNSTIHITASERQAWNGKQTLTGDTQNNVVTFNSGDTATPTSWADAPVLTSGEKHSSILNKVSTMFRNVRYLWQLIGNDQLSVGDGTITGAISSLNTSLDQVRHPYDSSGTIYVTGIISQKRVDTATGQVHYMIFIPFTFLYTLKSVIAIVVQNVVILRFDGTDANGFQLVNFFRNNQGLIFNFTTTSDAIDISGYFCDGALEFY